MYLIYGLGNPGENYKKNRHNVGFLFLDYLKDKKELTDFKKKNNFKYSLNNIDNHPCGLIKPMTYMNGSGLAVVTSMNFFKTLIDNIIVIYDDVSLPFGKIRIRDKGRDGGHNGLKSIQKETGTDAYKKIRVGIGEPEHKSALISHVLGNFTESDIKFLKNEIFPLIEDSIILFLSNNINEAMNKYNGLDLSKS